MSASTTKMDASPDGKFVNGWKLEVTHQQYYVRYKYHTDKDRAIEDACASIYGFKPSEADIDILRGWDGRHLEHFVAEHKYSALQPENYWKSRLVVKLTPVTLKRVITWQEVQSDRHAEDLEAFALAQKRKY